MTKQKTLGQIATEAREAYRAAHQGEGDPYDPHWLIRSDRHVASAIRAEVIEECAKAVEQRALRGDRVFNSGKVSLLIDAIRSLKEQPE